MEGTNAFCLMIGYEFFLDTIVTLTFFRCFIHLQLFPPGQDHLLYVRKNQRCGFPLDCLKYNR